MSDTATRSVYVRADVTSPSTIRFVERVMLAVPAEVAGNVIKAPLTENQAGILESIAARPWPGSGWTWSNNSTTERLLDALVAKGLVAKTEQGFGPRRASYRAIAGVSAAYHAQEQERQQAYLARQAEKNAAEREQAREALGRSQRLVRTLNAALDLLAVEQEDAIHGDLFSHVSREDVVAARAHVAAIDDKNALTQSRLAQ